MSAAKLLFRFRLAVMVLLHVLGFFTGFLTPWTHITGVSHGTLWLAASTLVARTGWLTLADATLTITLLGLACLATGTALRVCGTAYLGPHIMQDSTMQGERLVVAGPYKYVRNPLYLGNWFIGLATALLMPTAGAAAFLITYSAFLLFLIATEEAFLANRLQEAYLQYRRSVPRLIPRFSRPSAVSPAQSNWLRAILSETYAIGFTICFAILAWRYNARILIRCLLICYGFSLLMRAVNETAMDTKPGNTPPPRS